MQHRKDERMDAVVTVSQSRWMKHTWSPRRKSCHYLLSPELVGRHQILFRLANVTWIQKWWGRWSRSQWSWGEAGVTRGSSCCLSRGHTGRQTAVIARTRKRVHNEPPAHVFGCGKTTGKGIKPATFLQSGGLKSTSESFNLNCRVLKRQLPLELQKNGKTHQI